ncbi:MAG: 1-acyl-sn-glycerol-3-phosphate acyltransferase [Bacteroidales bacterium]|jgi:putative hemolysin|nr:1-acyl-sn-glycerol-3-phosphate acyltransferase [Bacteroidales bacterium]MCI2145954.1 1-acyl-sn-glycerol-3-phosphate acyltransferase [Bacteroidales bacterium]
MDTLQIDIDGIIKERTAKSGKKVPKFLVNYLKKIVHQDEINKILSSGGDLEGAEFIDHTLNALNISYSPHDVVNLDPEGRYVIVSNHPMGGLDGLILISYLSKAFPRKGLKVLTNDILMNLKPIKSLFVPINKFGMVRHEAAKEIGNVFQSNVQLLTFPAGLCSRKIKGRIADLEWKKSFVKKAVESGRDILPIYFAGRNSNKFYLIAKLRKLLGIKFNIEMMLLPDEMFKQRNASLDFYIRRPIPIATITKDHSYKEWTEFVRNKVYNG